MRNLLVTLVVVLFVQLAHSQEIDAYLRDPGKAPREHALDVQRMVVDVQFVPEEGKVSGKVVHEFTALRYEVDTVLFDAPDIEIKDVKLHRISGTKKPEEVSGLTWHTVKEGLVLELQHVRLKPDVQYSLAITYEAHPEKGIYFIGWNVDGITDTRNQTRQQIWTQGQGIDNRHWIPMYDNSNDKFITETVVTFNSDYQVLSNGDLKSRKNNKDNTTTWHYAMRHPHAGYLLMLAIDKYAVKHSRTATGVPVQFWYYPEHEDKVEYTSMYTEKMIEFLERETGYAYPWGTYSQVMVQDFLYGAMENTTATVFGDFFNSDAYSFNDRNYIGVNAHELTHQWFGDLVTARSNAGTWLQESFATYYAKLFIREIYGEDEFKMAQRGEVLSALAASKNDDYPVAHSRGGTARVYPKGSSVLQMLRYVLGDENYLRVIDAYLDKYAFKNVETNDLYQVILDELGLNLDWFFEQWLYKGGEPHYEVSYLSGEKTTHMVVRQIHERDQVIGLFKMPVWVAVHYTDGTSEKKQVWVEKETELISFKNQGGKKVAFVLFDVNSEITKQVTFKRTTAELLAQLAGAEHMIDRYDAIQALPELNDEIRKALHEAYRNNSFHSIREEIVKKLAVDKASFAFLKEVLPAADLRIRRAYLFAVDGAEETMREVVEQCLRDSSYINIDRALGLLVRSYPGDAAKYLEATAGVLGRNHELRINWLVYQITSGNTEYSNELVRYSSSLYEFRTRMAAFRGLIAVNLLTEESVQNLFDASLSLNRRLAGPAISTLQHFNKQEKYLRLIRNTLENSMLTEKEKSQLKNSGAVN